MNDDRFLLEEEDYPMQEQRPLPYQRNNSPIQEVSGEEDEHASYFEEIQAEASRRKSNVRKDLSTVKESQGESNITYSDPFI